MRADKGIFTCVGYASGMSDAEFRQLVQLWPVLVASVALGMAISWLA